MGCMGRVEREVLVRLIYCSSVGLKDKGGMQSDLPLNVWRNVIYKHARFKVAQRSLDGG